MNFLVRLSLIVLLGLALPSFAEQPSKELKRTAHRMHISAEQLNNAREALQDATDLAKKIEPYPVDQLSIISQTWFQLNHSKAKGVVESFIGDLHSRAADCVDLPCYQQALSTALMLVQSNPEIGYQEAAQALQGWPDPKDSFSDSATAFRDNMQAQVKRQALFRMANSDPEQALALLTQSGDSVTDAPVAGTVAQALLNSGKRDSALKLIDQTISGFDPSTADRNTTMEYKNFVQLAINIDPVRASTAVTRLLTALTAQDSPASCNSTLNSSNTPINLTCTESTVLDILRCTRMPGAAQKILDLVPSLKSKLNNIGGIDTLYSNPSAMGATDPASQAMNASNLLHDLRGKTESDPMLVMKKFDNANIESLINLAMSAGYQDPDLGSLALEKARQSLSEIQSIEKRASSMQNLVRAARQVDGEVDPDLLEDGFILADQLRQESKNGAADQLGAFLVSELSKDSFGQAMGYVRSMEDGRFKLLCLIQIVQAVRQPNL